MSHNSNKELLEACQSGDLDKIERLVAQGLKITNRLDSRFLSAAAYEGHLHVIKYLVAKGVNPRASMNDASYSAVCNGKLDVVKYFVEECKCNPRISPNDDVSLQGAVNNGHLAVAEYLISIGADVGDVCLDDIFFAASEGHYDMVRYFMKIKAFRDKYVMSDFFVGLITSTNAFLCMTHDVPIGVGIPFYESIYRERMLILINLMKGMIKCRDKEKLGPEWGNHGLYDSNLGMLICSYID